jgi:hypothetical protein
MTGDADGRQRYTLIVAVDPVAVVVVRARKTDHLPCGHVFVAAVNRVGKETVPRVRENEGEEALAVEAIEFEGAVFKTRDDLVLLVVGEISEAFAALFAAAGFFERSKLPVNEHRAAGVFPARRFRIGRNEAVDECFYGGGFVGCEIVPATWRNRRRRISRSRLPGQPAFDDCGRRGTRTHQQRNGAGAKELSPIYSVHGSFPSCKPPGTTSDSIIRQVPLYANFTAGRNAGWGNGIATFQ